MDGRCSGSKDFQCVTFGSTKVTLQVAQGQSFRDTVYLCQGDCDYYLPNSPFKGGDTTEFRVGVNQYRAVLKQVESRGSGVEPKIVQRVTMIVETK